MNQEGIMVSICCQVYNHERYIQKCLDGFLMQKTNFRFEVLIHDDASTDKSQEIIREYEEKYPDIIKPIYQHENQRSKGKRIALEYQYPRVKGRYIAMCEGDDFWIDEMKLQKQVDCLEKNKDSYISGHQVRFVNEQGNQLQQVWTINERKSGTINSKEFMKLMVSIEGPWFHTSSFLFRSECLKEWIDNTPEFILQCMVGDYPILLYGISKGNVEYINEELGCYRLGSISSVMKNEFADKYVQLKKNEIETYKLFDQYTGHLYENEVVEHNNLIEYKILFSEKNYNSLIKSKYRKYYSKKQYVFFRIMAIAPIFGWIEKIYLKLNELKNV